MWKISKTTLIREFWRACVLTIVVVAPAGPVLAQSFNSVREAASVLDRYPAEVEKFLKGVADSRLGPYGIRTQCTWCSERAWWGIGFCTRETTETWEPKIDFTFSRQRLISVLSEVKRNSDTFLSQHQRVGFWLDSVPELDRRFDETERLIQGLQTDIKAGKTPTASQRENVTAALQKLSGEVERRAAELRAITGQIASSLQRQSSYRAAINEAIGGADQSARDALANIETQSKSHRCRDGLKEKFDQIKNDFTQSIKQLSEWFQQLDASSRKTEQALAFLLGLTVNSQTEVKSILDQLKATKDDKLGTFILSLHLSNAKRRWEGLSDRPVASRSVDAMAPMSFSANEPESTTTEQPTTDEIQWTNAVMADHHGFVVPVALPIGIASTLLVGGVVASVAVAKRLRRRAG